MQLQIRELLALRQILENLLEKDMDSAFALRLYEMSQTLNPKLEASRQAVQKTDSDEEVEELLDETVEVDIEPFSVEEVTHFVGEVSPQVLMQVDDLFGEG